VRRGTREFFARSAFSRLTAVALCALAGVGCGQKGPPLPPLIRLPAAPELRADRRGSTVELAVVVPSANADGTRPANIARVDVYGLTGVTGSMVVVSDADLLKHGALVASLAVKSPRDPNDAVEPDEPQDDVEQPTGNGLDQGATGTAREQLNASAFVPVDLGIVRSRRATAIEPDRPLLGPSSAVPLRTYVGLGVSTSGRKGRFSRRVAVPLAPAPPPPSSPTISYTETTITVAWIPSPPSPPLPAGAQDQEKDVLPSRPLGPLRPALAYNVYDSATGALLTTTPVVDTKYADSRIAWGAERCYVVRAVDRIGGLSVESEALPPRCATLVDTFPPAAPKDLRAVSTAGVISLIWEANTERDLAGYIILRAPAPAERLDVIVSTPIVETTFNDAVQPGLRFVYAVSAVDKAGNASAPSNRVEETAR
jgi:hypothetical protein